MIEERPRDWLVVGTKNRDVILRRSLHGNKLHVMTATASCYILAATYAHHEPAGASSLVPYAHQVQTKLSTES